MNPCAGRPDLPDFESGPFNHLGTSPCSFEPLFYSTVLSDFLQDLGTSFSEMVFLKSSFFRLQIQPEKGKL